LEVERKADTFAPRLTRRLGGKIERLRGRGTKKNLEKDLEIRNGPLTFALPKRKKRNAESRKDKKRKRLKRLRRRKSTKITVSLRPEVIR